VTCGHGHERGGLKVGIKIELITIRLDHNPGVHTSGRRAYPALPFDIIDIVLRPECTTHRLVLPFELWSITSFLSIKMASDRASSEPGWQYTGSSTDGTDDDMDFEVRLMRVWIYAIPLDESIDEQN
jgi:hypothetical protein